ncbi:FMN-dependent NADH-azoreductase [Erythrobacter dokdonensis]|uniref:FMN dependent NADH:quinone oxidoreductase n=1 Tax=Erythrobacter dokdonensis DSW-74 TaxID=1300349 RepID=A0A1A7BIE3_9SPHN|nr:NAD(P)H-dependent oxidoreductase [Erythrobacter dokdonensis]OBV12244.1 FMN-dependent NADH-azoreductase [Erythrobacter dokdonensis DSW-74]
MSNILYVTASIRPEAESVSRGLGQRLVEGLAARTGASITTRDLATNDLPYVSAERFAANLAPAAERSAEQAELATIADRLIEELQAADTIVIASPIYNFGPPASLKAWADLVARAGTTFRYTANGPEGLLTGKKAYIAIASGGTPVGSDIDFMSRWLTFFLGFLGISDVEIVAADGIMGADGEAKIAAAQETALKLAA